MTSHPQFLCFMCPGYEIMLHYSLPNKITTMSLTLSQEQEGYTIFQNMQRCHPHSFMKMLGFNFSMSSAFLVYYFSKYMLMYYTLKTGGHQHVITAKMVLPKIPMLIPDICQCCFRGQKGLCRYN
jgi:hypothetical protein